MYESPFDKSSSSILSNGAGFIISGNTNCTSCAKNPTSLTSVFLSANSFANSFQLKYTPFILSNLSKGKSIFFIFVFNLLSDVFAATSPVNSPVPSV